MDPLSARMMLESEEASQCLVPDTRTSCILIDDSQLKPVALEDERLPSEEAPVPNARFLLGSGGLSGAGYRQAPTRSVQSTNAASNPSKFHIIWDKAYFATAVGALRLSIMGCMLFAILLLSFFKGDICHGETGQPHVSPGPLATTTTTPGGEGVGAPGVLTGGPSTAAGKHQAWLPQEAPTDLSSLTTPALPALPSPSSSPPTSLGVHLFICFVTLAAMVAWIAVDNSSFNYRFPFKWKLFDCCVYSALVMLLLASSSVLISVRGHKALAEGCRASVGKLDMAIAFSFLAVVIMLTLITLRFFDKDAPQPTRPSAASSSNPLHWVHRRLSRSKQTQILLQRVA